MSDKKKAVRFCGRSDSVLVPRLLCSIMALLYNRQDDGQGSSLEDAKEEKDKVKTLLRKLRSREAWHCTCKTTKPRPKMKAKSAIEGKRHDPKCLLQRTVMGERRWDGKNVGITLEDLKFLADRSLW